MDKKQIHRHVIRKTIPSLIIIILFTWVCALLMGALFAPVISRGDAHIIDYLFYLRYLTGGKEEISPYIIHVLMDDKSLMHGETPITDRDIVASLIPVLKDRGVRQIGLDILYQHAVVHRKRSPSSTRYKKQGMSFYLLYFTTETLSLRKKNRWFLIL